MDKEFINELIKPYGNKSKRSGIKSYGLLGDDSLSVLLVVFEDGSAYAYTPRFAGTEKVAEMRKLAQAGEGLATYIANEHPIGMKVELIPTDELKKPDAKAKH